MNKEDYLQNAEAELLRACAFASFGDYAALKRVIAAAWDVGYRAALDEQKLTEDKP